MLVLSHHPLYEVQTLQHVKDQNRGDYASLGITVGSAARCVTGVLFISIMQSPPSQTNKYFSPAVTRLLVL